MSFVYAKKYNEEINGEIFCRTNIFSDTKISLEGTSNCNWGAKTRKVLEKYGLIKSIIISPKCCISFAGNNIAHVHTLLSKLYDMEYFEEDKLVQTALDIHRKAPKGEIEFIICLADEKNSTEIICVKEGNLYRDCSSAWIGSYDAFYYLRKYQENSATQSESAYSAFNYAIRSCKDDSVGGFDVIVMFDNNLCEFVYPERLLATYEREQKVKSGALVKIEGTAEEGAYTAHYCESNEDVIITIEQANITLYYTKKYRLQNEDVDNKYTKHFLLPIVIESDTGKIIDII